MGNGTPLRFTSPRIVSRRTRTSWVDSDSTCNGPQGGSGGGPASRSAPSGGVAASGGIALSGGVAVTGRIPASGRDTASVSASRPTRGSAAHAIDNAPAMHAVPMPRERSCRLGEVIIGAILRSAGGDRKRTHGQQTRIPGRPPPTRALWCAGSHAPMYSRASTAACGAVARSPGGGVTSSVSLDPISSRPGRRTPASGSRARAPARCPPRRSSVAPRIERPRTWTRCDARPISGRRESRRRPPPTSSGWAMTASSGDSRVPGAPEGDVHAARAISAANQRFRQLDIGRLPDFGRSEHHPRRRGTSSSNTPAMSAMGAATTAPKYRIT
jgi:hypothetical protein